MLTAITKTYVRAIASGVASVKPSSPVRSAQNEKPGEHGDRAGRQVDEAGAPVGDDDAERDRGDRRPGPEAEQEEEEDLVHVVPWISADGAGLDRPRRTQGRRSSSRYLGGPIQPDALVNWNLPCVGERLEHVVADARRGLVLAALELRRPERERALERLRASPGPSFGVMPALPALTSLRNSDGRQELRRTPRCATGPARSSAPVLLDHRLVGRHALVGRIAVERRGDRVRPERPVAERLDHLRVEAERRGHDLARVGDAELLQAPSPGSRSRTPSRTGRRSPPSSRRLRSSGAVRSVCPCV